MSVDELGARLHQIARLAGIRRRVTPHVRTLQELAGYASPETTQIDTQVSMVRLRAAIEKLEGLWGRETREQG